MKQNLNIMKTIIERWERHLAMITNTIENISQFKHIVTLNCD
jgi:hypothetical protein